MNYMKDFIQIDIALDTFPSNDSVMTIEALFMGIPVISFYGDRRDTRSSLSLLKNIGLGDFAVNNANEYIERAVGLANDKEALNILHKSLRDMIQKSEAIQPKHYVRILEQSFENIIRNAGN